MAEDAEVQRYGCTDEEEEEQEELALLLQISGARLEDDVADFKHRLVRLEFAHLAELPEAKEKAEDDDGEAPVEDTGVGGRSKAFWHFEVSFAGESENWRRQRDECSC